MKIPAVLSLMVGLGLGGLPGALAQRPPEIGFVYPAGGQRGTTVEITIGGQHFQNLTDVHFSGSGVHGVLLDQARPPTPKEAAELRDRLQELRKKPKDAAVLGEMAQIARKLVRFGKRRNNPALAESATVLVTIAADAPLGRRELRLATPSALSNPAVFEVGELPEFRKPDPLTEDDLAALRQLQASTSGMAPVPSKTPEPPTPIRLPATVNGQILPGAADRYRFSAKQGQKLLVRVSARELIPYLADAVPGWFQAVVTLHDAQGRELACEDDFRFHPDPVMFYTIPASGEYMVEIRDALYRGREDFVYRMAVGELPFVAGVFPLGTAIGTQTAVEVWGWNLDSRSVRFDATGLAAGIHPLTILTRLGAAPPVPFAVDTLPETAEREPNNAPAHAQRLSLPVIVNGRVDKPADRDLFRIEGRAGEMLVAEVMARRLDSPLDSVLQLTDAQGAPIALNDDQEDKGSGLHTHHADSYLRAVLPADGPYYLHLADTQRQGGWAYGYRLRVSHPQPDFDLRVVPSALNVRGSGSVPLTVFALRKDGFTNEIALALKDAPAGYRLSGAILPANQDKVQLTLTVPPSGTEEPLPIRIEGRATVGGREVTRPAVPADDRMQAFIYRHLVPAQQLLVFSAGRLLSSGEVKILSPLPVRIPLGGSATVQVALPPRLRANAIAWELDKAPDGIRLGVATLTSDGTTLVLESDPSKVAPGLKGNLVVAVYAERAPRAAAEGRPAVPRRGSLGTLPAISFEVVTP